MDIPEPSSFSGFHGGVPVTHHLLAHRHRWTRVGWPLVIVTGGLVATLAGLWVAHPTWHRVEKWNGLALSWTAGIAISWGVALVLWAVRRRPILHTARRLDASHAAMNRLEAAAELTGAADAIANAQREETARFLSHTPIPPRHRLLPGLAIALGVAMLAHLITLGLWTWPWVRPAAAAAAKQEQPAAPAVPAASIVWKSPASETKAAPVEEVPLDAIAASAGGLRNLVLEIAVNGESRMSVPVPLDALSQPGKHEIQTSIYMDELSVAPYDMVSYYLHAKRIATAEVPEAVSPVQFVEIKPFRDDVREMPGGNDGKGAFALITALKAAQLRLLKENFLLSHAELSRDNPIWKTENKRVGDEQALLEKKSGEVIQKLIQDGTPATIVDLLNQAEPLMGQAAEKIGATQNQPAVPLQGKALALITEIEKYFIKIAAQGGSAKKAMQNVSDPFQTQKDIEMKQRFQTHAGELELLTREQARLADDLAKAKDSGADPAASATPEPGDDAKKPDPNRIDGSFDARQGQISQRIAALLNGQVFDPTVTEHLQKGHDQSVESLRQLDAQDVPSARNPAVVAAQELKLAQEAMDKAGEAAAKDQLAAALRALNQAANQAADAPKQASDQAAADAARAAAAKVEEARKNLGEAAKQQQETGSAQAAARLAAGAKALNDGGLRNEMAKLYSQPRNAAQADVVARMLAEAGDHLAGPLAGKRSADEIADLIARVERSRANLAHLAEQESNGGVPHPGGPQPQPGDSPGQQAAAQGQHGESKGQQGGSQPQPGNSQGKEGGQQGQQGQQGGSQSQRASPESQQGKPSDQPGSGGQKGHASGGSGGDRGNGGGNSTMVQRDQYAREVMQDVGEETAEARAMLPQATETQELDAVVNGGSGDGTAGQVVVMFGKIQAPLDAVIGLLQAELHRSERQYRLNDQSADKAPPAYREAVADYFERLSRDYKASEKSVKAE